MTGRTPVSPGDRAATSTGPRVAQDHCSNASDVVRTALIEGEESGPSTAFDFDPFLAEKREVDPTGP